MSFCTNASSMPAETSGSVVNVTAIFILGRDNKRGKPWTPVPYTFEQCHINCAKTEIVHGWLQNRTFEGGMVVTAERAMWRCTRVS